MRYGREDPPELAARTPCKSRMIHRQYQFCLLSHHALGWGPGADMMRVMHVREVEFTSLRPAMMHCALASVTEMRALYKHAGILEKLTKFGRL
jgi:hypothetical protein